MHEVHVCARPRKGDLFYLKFWLEIMVATEIAFVGWLSSTPINAKQRNALVCRHSAPFCSAPVFFFCTGKSSFASIK